MRAVQVVRLAGPSSVELRDVPLPQPRGDQVLVDVQAAGVSFPDVLQTRGLYQNRPELPFTLGSEVAGVVRQAPARAAVAPGDRVVAFTGIGAFAEAVVVPADRVLPLPDGLSFTTAAGLPLNYLTAQFALQERGHLRCGQSVLVHGAAGGVGTACIQLAAALGARVIAVVSSAAKHEVALAAGAHATVGVRGFREAVRELTAGAGVDLVVDPVGGDRFTDSLRSLAPAGRLLVIGFTAGDIPTVRVNRLLLNNIDVVGVGWAEYALGRPGYLAKQWAELQPHLRAGALQPLISATVSLELASDALEVIDQRRVTGKVVLQV